MRFKKKLRWDTYGKGILVNQKDELCMENFKIYGEIYIERELLHTHTRSSATGCSLVQENLNPKSLCPYLPARGSITHSSLVQVEPQTSWTLQTGFTTML